MGTVSHVPSPSAPRHCAPRSHHSPKEGSKTRSVSYAQDSQSKSTVPEDLAEAPAKSPRAAAFFKTLESNNRYAILFRVHTAKNSATRGAAGRAVRLVRLLDAPDDIPLLAPMIERELPYRIVQSPGGRVLRQIGIPHGKDAARLRAG